jgi:thiosulfate reductase cytochrome b subunit
MHRIYLHPLAVRIWHWINAAACVMMLLTGAQIRYVGVINVAPFRIAVTLHNWTGFVLIANFFLWLGFYLCSDRIRAYHADLNPMTYFRGSLMQAVYYGYGILKGLPNPFHPSVYRKFNPLQAMTYQMIMLLLLPIQCITGILLWDLTRFSGTVAMLGGLRVVDTVHVLIFIFFVFYIPAHIYLGTMGRTPIVHFKEMFTGYEEEDAESAVAIERRIGTGPAE